MDKKLSAWWQVHVLREWTKREGGDVAVGSQNYPAQCLLEQTCVGPTNADHAAFGFLRRCGDFLFRCRKTLEHIGSWFVEQFVDRAGQFFLWLGPNPSLSDDALLVDQVKRWKGGTPFLLDRAAIVPRFLTERSPCHFMADRSTLCGLLIVVAVHSHDREWFTFKTPGKLALVRYHLQAGAAPGGPEAEQDNLASILGKPHFATIEINSHDLRYRFPQPAGPHFH